MALISLKITRIILLRCSMLLLIFLSISANSGYAEGSKELAPDPSDRLFLYLNGDSYNNFGRYDGNSDQRLFFHISDPDNEQVFLGFSQAATSGHYPCEGFLISSFFRIKDPNGNVVYPIPGSNDGQLIDALSANISSKNQIQEGPSQIVGANGYPAFEFDPKGLPVGDYYIEFSRSSNTPTPGLTSAIEFWDITVASKDIQPAAKTGRVFSTNWCFYSPSISCGNDPLYTWFDQPFNGSVFIYSKDGFVNKLDFKDAGFQAAAFNLYFNESGANNTGNIIEDRKSISGLGNQLALHKIFLNDPDPSIYPSGEYGSLNSSPELHACTSVGGACILVEPTKQGQVEVLIDINKTSGDFIYDPNTEDVLIVFNITPTEGEAPPYQRCIPWDGKNGLGNTISLENAYDLLITYRQGVYHLPVYDVEFLLKGFSPTSVRPIPPSNILTNKLYFDDSNILQAPGTSIRNIELMGCEAPCHIWSNELFGDKNTINTWFFAGEETKLPDQVAKCVINAANDEVITNYQTDILIDIIANDLGEIIDTASIAIITPSVANGIININLNGTILYQPADGFIGLDSFQYKICYGIIPKNIICDIATVFVTVASETETNCEDGIDNDNDGFIDCDDSDCLPTKPSKIIRKK